MNRQTIEGGMKEAWRIGSREDNRGAESYLCCVSNKWINSTASQMPWICIISGYSSSTIVSLQIISQQRNTEGRQKKTGTNKKCKKNKKAVRFFLHPRGFFCGTRGLFRDDSLLSLPIMPSFDGRALINIYLNDLIILKMWESRNI